LETIPGSTDFNDFLDTVSTIKWFSDIGIYLDHPYRIHGWAEWDGPEHPANSALNGWLYELYEQILGTAKNRDIDLAPLWENVIKSLTTIVKDTVPYDENEDAWFAPNAAVWHAAWVGALIFSHKYLDLKLPKILQNQWEWFSRGHWPCAFAIQSVEEAESFKKWYRDGPPSEGFVDHMDKKAWDFVIF